MENKIFELLSSSNILGCFELIQNQERHKCYRRHSVLNLFGTSLLALSKALLTKIFQEVFVDWGPSGSCNSRVLRHLRLGPRLLSTSPFQNYNHGITSLQIDLLPKPLLPASSNCFMGFQQDQDSPFGAHLAN